MVETSIIAGAFNIEKYFSLKKSFESILKQTYTNFEFIICDDGSTDGTWEILCEYAKKDQRIKLLRNEKNKGLAFSLNRCLKEAQGVFVARHDLDDYCDERRLEKQIDYLKNNPSISILGCQTFLFDENGVWGKDKFPLQVTNKDFLFTSPYKHGSVVFRKSVLLQAGGYTVSKETYRTEDYDLFMRMQMFCKGSNLDEFLYYFCEDQQARQRRKYKYRIDEMKVRFRGFKKLGLMPKGFFYALKPLVVGLIPSKILFKLQKKHYKRDFAEGVKDDDK